MKLVSVALVTGYLRGVKLVFFLLDFYYLEIRGRLSKAEVALLALYIGLYLILSPFFKKENLGRGGGVIGSSS